MVPAVALEVSVSLICDILIPQGTILLSNLKALTEGIDIHSLAQSLDDTQPSGFPPCRSLRNKYLQW